MLNKAVFARAFTKPESDKLHILSNPNLLDNGGFQVWQKGTKFAITKQRMYAADRWMVGSDDGAVSAERSDGLLVTCTETGGALISQALSMDETNLRGQTVTLAVECEYTPGISPSLCLYSNEGNGYHLLKTVHFSAGNLLTATIPNDANFIACEVNSAGVPLSPGQFIRLTHAKLEVGPCFTGFLPIPYAEDLRRCQRYFINAGRNNDRNVYPGYIDGSNRVFVLITAPVPMFFRPKPFYSGRIWAKSKDFHLEWNVTNVVPELMVNNQINIAFSVNGDLKSYMENSCSVSMLSDLFLDANL